MGISRIVKPKNQRVKRALEKRDPKIHENDKNAIIMRGGHTSEEVTRVLKDLYLLKKPLAQMFRKKNIMRPFEDQTSLEFFANKCDSSLFIFGSHSKKRPNNLVFGRLFDFQMLDMIELGVESFRPLAEFDTQKCGLGTKPCLMFIGEAFDEDPDYKRLKSLFIDLFRGPVVSNVRLQGLEHVWTFTAVDGNIYLRSYRILLKKSGSRTPRVELKEMGPSLDLVTRRTKLASDDLYRRACKVPKEATPRKKKNISRDAFGTKLGRIHMQKQDLDKLQTRKLKGLKRRNDVVKSNAGDEEDSSKKAKQEDESSAESS